MEVAGSHWGLLRAEPSVWAPGPPGEVLALGASFVGTQPRAQGGALRAKRELVTWERVFWAFRAGDVTPRACFAGCCGKPE